MTKKMIVICAVNKDTPTQRKAFDDWCNDSDMFLDRLYKKFDAGDITKIIIERVEIP